MAYAMHDRALKALQWTGPELRNEAPNHAPMVIEALAALGRDDAVSEWIENYRPRLAQVPRSDAAIQKDWKAALGDFNRFGEWRNLFDRELVASPWREVLEKWLPRLIPGSMAAGTHGVIRCGHACRALENEVTALRLKELANALAYCAARYRMLGTQPILAGPLGLKAAVRGLPFLDFPIDRRGPPPLVVEHLNGGVDFARAVNRLTQPSDVTSALNELAEIGARLYLRDATRHPLVLLHAVTGPAAAQLLLANVSPILADAVFAYMWQAVAAWAAAFSTGLSVEPIQAIDRTWDEIIDFSVASGDEHAIKFTEACHRLDALRPSPIFRVAARDWAHRVVESRNWSTAKLLNAGIRTRGSHE